MTSIGPLFQQLNDTSRPGAQVNTTIATDFNRFLNLLTVQLQNQDPLAPMDSNEFTQQIVQMTQVEQTVSMNERLGSLIDAQETQRIQSAVEFVGKNVDALSQTIPLGEFGANMFYDLPIKAASVRLDIVDANILNPAKSLITSLEGAPNEAGLNRVFWDGSDQDGALVDPDREYALRVVALDVNGQQIQAQSGVSGLATELRNESGALNIIINGKPIPLSSVVAARAQQQSFAAPTAPSAPAPVADPDPDPVRLPEPDPVLAPDPAPAPIIAPTSS